LSSNTSERQYDEKGVADGTAFFGEFFAGRDLESLD
jgi:hypothetical protein